jgi:hypothetical protein
VSRGRHWPCRTVPNSGRDGLPPGVGGTAPGRDSQARQSSGATYRVRALNARTRVREQVRAGARERRVRVPSSGAGPARGGCSALERGVPCSRGAVEPSSETDPARGGVRASSKADFARGSVYPSSEADFTRGVSVVSSWRARGPPGSWWCYVRVFRCAN